MRRKPLHRPPARRIGADDLAQEFALAAVRRLANGNPARCAFSTWAIDVARGHAKYLRSKVLRLKRDRWTVGQFARAGGEEFDRFAATADLKALEPWEILAEREET